MGIIKSFCYVDEIMAVFEKRLSNPVDPDTQVLKSLYEHLQYYEDIAKRTLPTDLDEAIESEVEPLREEIRLRRCSTAYLEKTKETFESFTPRLKMMEEQFAEGLYNDEGDDDDDDDRDAVSSKVIGVSEVYKELKKKVMRENAFKMITSLVGMPGIGKTTLAKKLLRDPTVVARFDRCVWVRVGKNCRVKDVPRNILAEMDPGSLPGGDEDAVNEYLKASLKSKKYLIVLDDVWNKYMAYLLNPFPRYDNYELDHPFLHGESGSRILLISRTQQVRPEGWQLSPDIMITMRLLTEKESWDLFCERVFSGGPCPPQLEKAGKKISKICEGLPLTILAVARLLSEEESTLEYWSKVAENQNHQLFKEAYEEISKVLLPSYTYLPPLLRMCFLYLGVFPQKYKIPRSKLINLWLADKFDEINIHTYLNTRAVGYLLELVSNNLARVYQKSISNAECEVKTCGLHSSLWYLSNKKARETKFALVLRSRDDGLGDGIKGQRRLSFHNNVLFAIKDVHKSVELSCASSTRSLLCYGPYYQYQVPICFGLKLLTELDALLINFYKFPVEVLQLVQLRYLALTMNGPIPASISQLSNLQFFIVNRHLSIKAHKNPSCLPMEIWGMKEIRHLQVMGNDLPDPDGGASLKSLLTLLNVSAHSCTKVVLNAVPNLKRLGIQIELTPDKYGDDKVFSCLDHVSCLRELDSLKCVIINPIGVPPIMSRSSFPMYLRKLTLSGLCYPWKKTRMIGSLRFLNVLKLENYAFQGPLWGVEGEFRNISSLVIEDTDLVNWEFGYESFPCLRLLSMKHCYKLEYIGLDLLKNIMKIELVDCNPFFAKKLKKDILENEARDCTLDVHSSWDEA